MAYNYNGTGKRLKMNGYEQGVILDLMRGTSWIEGFFEAIEGICLSSPKLASEYYAALILEIAIYWKQQTLCCLPLLNGAGRKKKRLLGVSAPGSQRAKA
ncbi:hypothetical protein LOAG_08809 [Loa loa]|uniref:Uncharacterized protein n=1 Tax=Loa loa TaxID=7209 RepID=A0A1S0TT80_LOALO|nr:hypothetical protein LOAG_08809 [Loa loa]EFO19683.1 hypothetical protein LOAG_08809 [Loa loa]